MSIILKQVNFKYCKSLHYLFRHIEFRFRTYAEAQEAVEKLKEVREEIVAKQLSLDVSAG